MPDKTHYVGRIVIERVVKTSHDPRSGVPSSREVEDVTSVIIRAEELNDLTNALVQHIELIN